MSASTITIVQQVSVTPNRAFQAWVKPEELARWWWPHWSDTTYEVDGREGGEYRFHSAEASVGATGIFTAFDQDLGFTMTWIWIDGDGTEELNIDVVDIVEVRFVENGEGTVVTVLHTSTEHEAEGRAEQSWKDTLARFPGHFSIVE